MERRLTTILAADVVGYSRMMEQAEESTAAQLQACQNLISDAVENGGGRVFNRAGDAAFAEFSSPIMLFVLPSRSVRNLLSQARLRTVTFD